MYLVTRWRAAVCLQFQFLLIFIICWREICTFQSWIMLIGSKYDKLEKIACVLFLVLDLSSKTFSLFRTFAFEPSGCPLVAMSCISWKYMAPSWMQNCKSFLLIPITYSSDPKQRRKLKKTKKSARKIAFFRFWAWN